MDTPVSTSFRVRHLDPDPASGARIDSSCPALPSLQLESTATEVPEFDCFVVRPRHNDEVVELQARHPV